MILLCLWGRSSGGPTRRRTLDRLKRSVFIRFMHDGHHAGLADERSVGGATRYRGKKARAEVLDLRAGIAQAGVQNF